MATILITHDLALASEYCDRIVVMHAGHVVETAPTARCFAQPRHPYTARLIASTPAPEQSIAPRFLVPATCRTCGAPICRAAASTRAASARCRVP
jgi:peptide/nickel transport system ATP-binding protein